VKKKLSVILSVLLSVSMMLTACGGSNAEIDFGIDFGFDFFSESEETEPGAVEEVVADAEAVVEFQDPLVERCVRKTLGKSYDEEITIGECRSIKSLLVDCKLDSSFSVWTMSATGSGDMLCNYVDFCDFKYLTGLEELYIDNQIKYDTLVNLDAIGNCAKLKKLCMQYNPMGTYYSGDMPKGYKYLQNIICNMPELEYLDLGYFVPTEFKQMLQGENTNLVISDGENASYGREASSALFYRDEERNWNEVEMVEDYAAGWDYVYDGNGADAVQAKSILTVGSISELETVLDLLPAETEDIVLHVKTMDVLDFELFLKFPNLKTLSIAGNNSSVLENKRTPVKNIGKLNELPELFALNMAGCSGDFAEIGELKNLKELSVVQCGFDSCEFLSKMQKLRELIMISYVGNEENYDVLEYIDGMPGLRYLSTRNVGNLEGIENAESLETVRCFRALTSFEPVGKSNTVKNVIISDRAKEAVDLSPLENMKQLEMLVFVGGDKVTSADAILALPKLISIFARNIDDMEDEQYPVVMNQLIGHAAESDSLSLFCVMDIFRDGDFSNTIDYGAIHLEKLWEAGIFDEAYQYSLHYYEEGVWGFETYEEVRAYWQEYWK